MERCSYEVQGNSQRSKHFQIFRNSRHACDFACLCTARWNRNVFNNPHQSFVHRRRDFYVIQLAINFYHNCEREFCRCCRNDPLQCKTIYTWCKQFENKVVCTRVDHASWWNEATCRRNLLVKLTEVTYQSWPWSQTRWRGLRKRLLLKLYKLCGRIMCGIHEGWE